MGYEEFEAPLPIDRNRLPKWQLFRVPPLPLMLEFTVVSRRVIPVHTHFDGRGRRLCRQAQCPAELHARGARWYGYCQVVIPHVHVLAIMEVTEESFRQMKENCRGTEEGFRGMVFRMKRAEEKRNSRIDVKSLEMLSGIEPLPDELDIWPMVLKLYKVQ